MFFLRKFPTYHERLHSRDERPTLSRLNKILPFVLFIVFNFICLFFSVFFRLKEPEAIKKVDYNFTKYFGTFGYWFVTAAWHKAMEGTNFREADLLSPSIEIGFCRGNISSLHFEGKHFDFGSEYLFFEAKKSQDKFGLWKHVYSDDLSKLALKSGSIETICTVHVIDHVADLEVVMSELSRILNAGGKIYFSGFSDYHFHYSLIFRFLNLFNSNLAKKFSSLLAFKRGSYNLLTVVEWQELLDKHGLKLEAHKYVESGLYSYICYFLHFVCFSNLCFEFDFIKKGFFRPFLEKLFYFYYVSIGAPEYLRTQSSSPDKGDNFFITAVKK